MDTIILGDIHKKWSRVNKIVNYELAREGIALSTGDLCNYNFRPQGNQKLAFCHGNHENFEHINELINNGDNSNLIALSSGRIYKFPNGIKLTALPGVFSQYFHNRGGNLKYFSRRDLDKIFEITEEVDILLTHEAPKGIGVEKNGRELGIEQINWVIDHIRPKISFFGHHHYFYSSRYNGTRVIGLDMPHRSYIRLNPRTFLTEIVTANLKERKGYRYDWEE